MNVRGEQLTQEVNTALVDAEKIGRSEPDTAITGLKRMENIVLTASDIEPRQREQLVPALRNAMNEFRNIREHQNQDKVRNAERLAQIEARRKTLQQMQIEENKLDQLIDQCRAHPHSGCSRRR